MKIREHRPSAIAIFSDDPNDLPSMAIVEERYLRQVLDVTRGNKTMAAKILKVDRRTLYRSSSGPTAISRGPCFVIHGARSLCGENDSGVALLPCRWREFRLKIASWGVAPSLRTDGP